MKVRSATSGGGGGNSPIPLEFDSIVLVPPPSSVSTAFLPLFFPSTTHVPTSNLLWLTAPPSIQPQPPPPPTFSNFRPPLLLPFFSFPLHLFLTHLLVEVTEKRGEGGKRGERPSLTQLSQLQHPMREGGEKDDACRVCLLYKQTFCFLPPSPFFYPAVCSTVCCTNELLEKRSERGVFIARFSTVKLNSNSILLSFLAF